MSTIFNDASVKACYNKLFNRLTVSETQLSIDEQKNKVKFRIGGSIPVTTTVKTLMNPEGETVKLKHAGAYREGYVDYKEIDDFLSNDCECRDPSMGIIGFDLWSSADRINPGWLYYLFRQRTKPIALLFALKQNDKPIATVAFEDIEALQKRLSLLAKFDGFDIDEWNIPTGKLAQQWKTDDATITNTTWYVPLVRLHDLATINFIGDPEAFEAEGENKELQLERYEFLSLVAHGYFA